MHPCPRETGVWHPVIGGTSPWVCSSTNIPDDSVSHYRVQTQRALAHRSRKILMKVITGRLHVVNEQCAGKQWLRSLTCIMLRHVHVVCIGRA